MWGNIPGQIYSQDDIRILITSKNLFGWPFWEKKKELNMTLCQL